ncbi:hypothetical protein D3C72_1796050 [compost metagenome]
MNFITHFLRKGSSLFQQVLPLSLTLLQDGVGFFMCIGQSLFADGFSFGLQFLCFFIDRLDFFLCLDFAFVNQLRCFLASFMQNIIGISMAKIRHGGTHRFCWDSVQFVCTRAVFLFRNLRRSRHDLRHNRDFFFLLQSQVDRKNII